MRRSFNVKRRTTIGRNRGLSFLAYFTDVLRRYVPHACVFYLANEFQRNVSVHANSPVDDENAPVKKSLYSVDYMLGDFLLFIITIISIIIPIYYYYYFYYLLLLLFLLLINTKIIILKIKLQYYVNKFIICPKIFYIIKLIKQ